VRKRAGDAAARADVAARAGAAGDLAAATAAGFTDTRIVGVCPRRTPDPAVVIVGAGSREPVRVERDGVKGDKTAAKIAGGQADQDVEVGIGLALVGTGTAASGHAVGVAVVAGRAVRPDIRTIRAARDAPAAVRVVEAPPAVLHRTAKASGVGRALRVARRAAAAAGGVHAPGDVRVPASFALGSASAVR